MEVKNNHFLMLEQPCNCHGETLCLNFNNFQLGDYQLKTKFGVSF